VSSTTRPFDIVVWGATGFAGQLVADHLTGQYSPDSLDLALGGRNEAKLERLAEEVANETDDWDEIPVVVAGTAPMDRVEKE